MCKLDDTFTFIHLEKDSLPCFGVSMKYLVVWILWPELRIYLQGVWLFDKFKNTLRSYANFNFENLSHKFLADFDNKIKLLDQNSFE